MIREQFLQRTMEEMCRHNILEEDYIRKNANTLPWNYISRFQPLSLNFIREYQDRIDWRELCQNDKIGFTLDFVREFEDKVSWIKISEQDVIAKDENAIIEFNKKINYTALGTNINNFTPELLERFEEEFDWIIIDPNLYSEEFIDRHSHQLRIKAISFREKRTWSEWFLRKYNKYLDFFELAYYQPLSESFIREFQNRLDWSTIVRKQKLSKNFVREISDSIGKLRWGVLCYNPLISDDTKEEFKKELDYYL